MPALRPARLSSTVRRGSIVLAGVAVAVVVSGCTAGPASPVGTSATPAAPPESVAPPQFVPDGSATDNLPVFTAVMDAVAAGPEAVAGRAYVDALVAAGFDRAAMQVTADVTSIGDPVDSLQFSVQQGAECLIGQVGPSTPAPTALIVPELPSGGCLLGRTRPIDW